MLRCGDPAYGFATYICLHCGETKQVAFSCKSRVCSSCGKVHADEWSRQLVGRLFNVTHRHITFTVADKLWPLLEAHPGWRKVLFPSANAAIRRAIRNVPGIAMVMHPYGKDLKVNYHLHVLVTEGGLDEQRKWQEQTFINYKTLRKVWQYEVLTRLRAEMRAAGEPASVIDQMFRQYQQGFYVYAKPRVKNGQGIGRYIGRYIRHPAIADTRIIGYDGQEVTFYYKVRREGKVWRQKKRLPVLEFIHSVVRHIPTKHFKLVRYYGLYAPRTAEKVGDILARIGTMMGQAVGRLSWRARIRQDFHRDPLCCPRCGEPGMELYSLTVPSRGRLVTLGGWPWLLASGAVAPARPPPLLLEAALKTLSAAPQAVQLSFHFDVKVEAKLRWTQPALL